MLKRLGEQDHYQVLEVDYTAGPEEIQTAYESAREIYGGDSLVSSSILDREERRQILSRVTQAYHTLIAGESRRLYDETLAESMGESEGVLLGDPRNEKASVEPVPSASPDYPRLVKGSQRPQRRCKIQLSANEEASGDFLRRARESTGLDLRTIAEETKIGVTMLHYVEDEQLDRLPVAVYLRNFVSQYARCLGLQEKKVARSFMARIERLRSGQNPSA